MKKKERGVFETYSNEEVILCQWNDNKPVCIVRNFEHGSKVECRKEKQNNYNAAANGGKLQQIHGWSQSP